MRLPKHFRKTLFAIHEADGLDALFCTTKQKALISIGTVLFNVPYIGASKRVAVHPYLFLNSYSSSYYRYMDKTKTEVRIGLRGIPSLCTFGNPYIKKNWSSVNFALNSVHHKNSFWSLYFTNFYSVFKTKLALLFQCQYCATDFIQDFAS